MNRMLALLVLGCLLGVGFVAADDRVPVPPPADIEKASKLVRELFKDDYAKPGTKAKAALAEQLFKQAEESGDDPAAQFVLFREAADLAAAGGDVDLGLRAVDRLLTRFEGVKPTQIEPLLKSLAGRATTAEANLALTDYLLRLTDTAVAADDLDTATRLVNLAASTAAKSKIVRTVNLVVERRKEIDAFRQEAGQVKAALETLAKNPNDPDASTTAGRYYCFQKDDWEKGLGLLAAGSDAKLKDAARKDLAGPKTPPEQLAVADAWYDLGTATTGPGKRAMLGRAYTFYVKAAPELNGLNRTKAEKRIEDLEKQVEGKGPHEELWAAVRAAVRAKDTEDLTPLGGFISKKTYRDVVPGAGVLIGFNYTTKSYEGRHDIMDYMQPIYLTPDGERTGAGYGKKPPKFQTVKAKPGYAVGAIRVSGGGLLGGVSLIYMRIQGKGLNPADKYESPWLGRDVPPQSQPIVGDGRIVIGIHGKLRSDGDEEICSIAPVVAGPKPPASKKQ